MVVERVHNTNLPSHMIFNGLRQHLLQFQVQASEVNNWHFYVDDGKMDGNGASVLNKYMVKVGGTEVY